MMPRLREALDTLRAMDVFTHAKFATRSQECSTAQDEETLTCEIETRLWQIRRVKLAMQGKPAAPKKPRAPRTTPAPEREKEIEEAIRAYLRARGAFEMKIWTGGIALFDGRVARNNNKGASDIICCWRGKFLAIEVKTQTGRVTPEQKQFLDDVQSAGGVAFVARSVADVERECARIESR